MSNKNVKVDSYKRKTQSGKVTKVKSHYRSKPSKSRKAKTTRLIGGSGKDTVDAGQGNTKKDIFLRAMTGAIPESLEEAVTHDLVGTAQGLIPGVPEPAGMIRTGRMATHEHLSAKAKGMGTTMQGADTILSAVDPTSISDLVFFENTLWYLFNREEIEQLKSEGKLQGGYGQGSEDEDG